LCVFSFVVYFSRWGKTLDKSGCSGVKKSMKLKAYLITRDQGLGRKNRLESNRLVKGKVELLQRQEGERAMTKTVKSEEASQAHWLRWEFY
jgi:ATP phosphoribosyltransferase